MGPTPIARTWLTTAEMCESLGITRGTLRRWVNLGLIDEPEVVSSGRQGRRSRWPQEARERAHWIQSQRDEGFTLSEIAQHLAREAE